MSEYMKALAEALAKAMPMAMWSLVEGADEIMVKFILPGVCGNLITFIDKEEQRGRKFQEVLDYLIDGAIASAAEVTGYVV